MAQRFSCAREARARGEPVHGTASPVRRWLLLEQDGPWGRDAVLESRLDPALARALKARAARLRARLLLIRRRGVPAAAGPRAYVASSTERGSWVEEFRLDGPADLLDVDLAPMTAGASVGGQRLDGPLYLVCTNGRHDACCAEFGRPVTRVLASAQPQRTWESSHVGGDRFAGNLVCLPEGVYYGHVGPLEAPRIVAAHARGRIVLDHFRGRSCYSFVVQAADCLVRAALGLDRIDDLALAGVERGPGDLRHVTFVTPAGDRHVAEITFAPATEVQRLTCTALSEEAPPRYALRSLVSEPAGRGVTGSSYGRGTASPRD